MFIPAQSLPIFLQQSISSCVTIWLGIKHTTCGTTAQIISSIKTETRRADVIEELYRDLA
jgi:hypothetical protein